MRDLSMIARNIATASSLGSGVVQLQRDICKLLHVTDALCIWIDWPRRTAWSVTGKLGVQVQELVLDVAGSNRHKLINNTLVEPIGPCPARAALALRRPWAPRSALRSSR